jgi:hypothetical protein
MCDLKVSYNHGKLKPCIECPGITDNIDVSKPIKSKHKNKYKCGQCRTWKTEDQFPISEKTNRRKTICWKCDEYQKRRRIKQRKPPPPPHLCIFESEQSNICGSAQQKFGLEDCQYYRTYLQDGVPYLEASFEQQEGFFSFWKKPGSKKRECGARGIARAIKVPGGTKLLIEPTDDPMIFRLREE